jgi:hypothetical protein
VSDHQMWPEWLTDEHTAIHTAIENEIKRALAHCIGSADAAGMDWTTEGWISCSASNVMGMLERLGCPPPPVGEVERMPMPEENFFDADVPLSFAGTITEAVHDQPGDDAIVKVEVTLAGPVYAEELLDARVEVVTEDVFEYRRPADEWGEQ